MNFCHGRSLKLLTLTSLCALVWSCNQNHLQQDKTHAENIVKATTTKQVVNSSKVIDFQISAVQELSHRGSLALPDVVKKYPELSERTHLLASVDHILETATGHWEFFSNFKLLLTLVSSDRQSMQAINGQEHLFNTIALHTNVQTKLTDAVSPQLLLEQ
ncbi:MAG: hypothetical protein V4654_09225 [Bdellovibrionota bacterium]